MDKILSIFLALSFAATLILTPSDGIASVVLTLIMTAGVVFTIRTLSEDGEYLTRVFVAALTARLAFGLMIHVFDLREFFGGDALTYDTMGQQINDIWFNGAPTNDPLSIRATSTNTPGWGLNYLTAILYAGLGRNILAAQSFCAVIGAATAPMVHACAFKIFKNRQVGRVAALMVALFPAFIIWSGQLLKDGLIIFLLVVVMTMVLTLQERLNYFAVLIMTASMFGVLSLRFYIFYMVAIAVVGSFIIGTQTSAKSVIRGFVILIVCALGMTYFGVLRTATENFDKWGNLDSVQRSRLDQARSADSGFGGDVDVSTTGGAISAIPIGFSYLMFAPFPWQLASVRQAITIPEMIVWWSSFPLLVIGIIYTVKNRLRNAIPILIFTLMLTLAYSVFQSNVGTAYRQRTQIQVFLFIFVAVGWTLRRETKENQRAQNLERQSRIDRHLRDMRQRSDDEEANRRDDVDDSK